MKKTIVILLTFSLLGMLFASFKKSPGGVTNRTTFIGMVKCSDLYYVDQTEVTVDSWLSYYNWILENEGSESAKKVLPDSIAVNPFVWQYIKSIQPAKKNQFITSIGTHTGLPMPIVLAKCDDLMSQDPYYRNNKNKDCPYGWYPVTGLSYKQVTDFCIWKTKIVGNGSVIFRLPSAAEWKEIVLLGINGTSKLNGLNDSIFDYRGFSAAFNHRLTIDSEDYEAWGEDGISVKPVEMFKPDRSKICDLFGNISEMTLEEGISKGGNYSQYAYQCHADSVQIYKKPETWLGFRCIVKMK